MEYLFADISSFTADVDEAMQKGAVAKASATWIFNVARDEPRYARRFLLPARPVFRRLAARR
jgi:hypothetical protein